LKVILTRDYEKLGNTGDIINVKDGFANNFLIPNNIAILATSGNIKQMELVKKSLIKKEAKNIEEAQKIAEVVDGIELKFKVNSSPDGKLYGSITNKDIAEMILEDKKIEIDRKKIELEDFCGTALAGFSNTTSEYNNLTQLGAHWVRVHFSWRDIERDYDDDWDFTRYDTLMDNATKYNIKVIAMLNYPRLLLFISFSNQSLSLIWSK